MKDGSGFKSTYILFRNVMLIPMPDESFGKRGRGGMKKGTSSKKIGGYE
jgi:hypothetical protein